MNRLWLPTLTDAYALDPFGMKRPASIITTTAGGVQRWATGAYAYDAQGNVTTWHGNQYEYDPLNLT